MTRIEQLLEQSAQCARELADALRAHADVDTIRALQERFSCAQRSWQDEARRTARPGNDG